jgi:hypothetical protein
MTTDATLPGVSRSKPIDWEAVERAYRAGMLSLREIAAQHGLSDTAIRKRAKRDGWARDLTAKVRERVRSQLVRIETETANENELVDEAANQVVAMVREHRKGIRQLRSIAERLATRLTGELDGVGEDGKQPSLLGHAAAVRELSTVMKTLVPLERQAFNADEPEPPKAVDGAPATALDALLGKLAAIVPQVAV